MVWQACGAFVYSEIRNIACLRAGESYQVSVLAILIMRVTQHFLLLVTMLFNVERGIDFI